MRSTEDMKKARKIIRSCLDKAFVDRETRDVLVADDGVRKKLLKLMRTTNRDPDNEVIRTLRLLCGSRSTSAKPLRRRAKKRRKPLVDVARLAAERQRRKLERVAKKSGVALEFVADRIGRIVDPIEAFNAGREERINNHHVTRH
jgi:hypothetical protein